MQVSSLVEVLQRIESYLGRNVSMPRVSDLSTERNTDDETALKPIQTDTNGEKEFADFAWPSSIKIGHLVPLSCGHNGNWSKAERALLEVHLLNAGVCISLS